jgi:hypothetical protein
MFEFESGIFHLVYLYLCIVWRIVFACLVVQVAGAAWRATMRIVAGVGDLMQRIVDSHTGRVLDGRMMGGRVTPCTICTLHVEMRSTGFLVEPQNQGRRFVSGLASKPLGQFSLVWPQNRW